MPAASSISCSWTGFSRGRCSTRCGLPSTASTNWTNIRTAGSARPRRRNGFSAGPAASWSSYARASCSSRWTNAWGPCSRHAVNSEKHWRCSTFTRLRGWRGATPATTARWSSKTGKFRMWRVRVVHSTGYAYESPATASFNEARLTPRSDNRQNVILSRVETVPATRSYRYLDYWGTAVTAFDLHAPHTELEVTASSVVETDKPEPPIEKVTWDELRSDAVVDKFDEVLSPTHYTPRSKRLRRVGERIANSNDPHDAVIAAADWVNSELDYVAGTTGVHSSALDALREGKGGCQDFAHVTLAVLAGIGIPSRYVSGYLHPQRKAPVGETVDGQSHAWIQAWTGGWWNFDPTNDKEINEQYVSVGVGRDYADVTPLKGIYSGGGSTDLDVTVEITRLA